MLLAQWDADREALSKQDQGGRRCSTANPRLAVRIIREEFNSRTIAASSSTTSRPLRGGIKGYVEAVTPAQADRIEFYDAGGQMGCPLFERHHIHEQLHKALDRKVWLPVWRLAHHRTHRGAHRHRRQHRQERRQVESLEETVFHNNLEAAEEIANQLRLRDIGGIIVIDFIDMEIKDNRDEVIEDVPIDALARDKTRTQVFDISELGLVEMTRKRIGEGLLNEYSDMCPDCEGRGVVVDYSMLE